MEVPAGYPGIDAVAVDDVQEADFAEHIARVGGDSVEDGVELDQVEKEHDQGEEPPEGGQEPRRRRLQGQRQMEIETECRFGKKKCWPGRE